MHKTNIIALERAVKGKGKGKDDGKGKGKSKHKDRGIVLTSWNSYTSACWIKRW
jgi:hypothetical protein